MEIEQLRAFVNLSQTKSFSKTAEMLHVVQSTISARIRLLEDSVGKPLFLRDTRTVALTAAGQALLQYAQRVLKLCAEGESAVRTLGTQEESFTVGSTDSLWQHLFKDVLLEFAKRHPNIALTTKTAHSWELIQSVIDGVVHLALVFTRPRLPGVVSCTVYEDEVVLVTSPKHAAAERRRKISRADLATLPFLTCDWDGPFADWVQTILPRNYRHTLFPDQLRLLIALLLDGRGIAFVPRFCVAREIEKGTLVKLATGDDLSPPRRKVYAIFRQEKKERAGLPLWLALLKESGYRIRK